MARATVEVRGSRELRDQLRRLGADADAASRDALRVWAGQVRDAARRDVPVDTGYLRDHIEARVESGRARVGVWDADAYYSRWVELGSSRQAAQPFLLPAFERAKSGFRRQLAREIERRLG